MSRAILRSTPILIALAALLAGAAPASAAPRFRPVADDVFYMYMPIAWRDSDGDAARFGDFGGMTASIPYLKSLGVTAVWMTPTFPSAAYHGYQHGDADSLRVEFGTRAAFWSFVQAAHAESIKVFLDFVVYGSSQNTPQFQSAFGNPASPFDDWFAFTNGANTNYLGCCPYTTWDGSTVGFVHWDLRNPAVTQRVTDWAIGWLDPDRDGDPADGVDGFRLDHVSAYHPTESPWGYDLAWWQGWKSALQAVNPDVFTFAEQADWGSYGAELLGPFDAAFTKPFEFAARSGISSANASTLASSMATTMSLKPDSRLYLATLGDHDVERLANSLSDVPGRLRVAAAVQFLQPLPPVIYFGDELGMRGAKRTDYAGDAADIPFREPFKWNAVAGAPMSNYFVLNTAAYNGRVARDNDGRSVQEQSGVSGSLLEHYRTLSALRRAHPGLRSGTFSNVPASAGSVWSFVKQADGETLLVAIQLGSSGATVNVDLSGFDLVAPSTPVTDVVSGASLAPLTAANRAAYPVTVTGYGYRVLRVRLATPDMANEYADADFMVLQDSPALVADHRAELDQMFLRSGSTHLDVGITGNLVQGAGGLVLLIDALAGGQSTLATSTFPALPDGVQQLSGLQMDEGFVPERMLFMNPYQGVLYADWYTLADAGGGTHRYLGSQVVGSDGVATGGSNPNAFAIGYSDGNRAGVTLASAANAASATDGFRLSVPWADLGLAGPATSVKLLAMLVAPDGTVSNQLLPGTGGRTSPVGLSPVSLRDVPGQQFVTLFDAVSAGDAAPIAPSLRLLSANPGRGALRVAFERRSSGPAAIRVLDVSGRVVASHDLSRLGRGRHELQLARDGALRPGLYFVRLREGDGTREVRAAVVR